jgi:fatty acid desaturase
MMVKLLIVWKRFWRISHSLHHVLTEQSDQQTAWFITTYKLDSKHYDCNNNAYPRFPHYFSNIMAIILIRSGKPQRPSWSWSYGGRFYNYLCISPLMLWRGVLDTTLCDKLCQWLGYGISVSQLTTDMFLLS